jgi:hypothetical protein
MTFYATNTRNIVQANETAISATDEETIYYTKNIVIACERALGVMLEGGLI